MKAEAVWRVALSLAWTRKRCTVASTRPWRAGCMGGLPSMTEGRRTSSCSQGSLVQFDLGTFDGERGSPLHEDSAGSDYHLGRPTGEGDGAIALHRQAGGVHQHGAVRAQ